MRGPRDAGERKSEFSVWSYINKKVLAGTDLLLLLH